MANPYNGVSFTGKQQITETDNSMDKSQRHYNEMQSDNKEQQRPDDRKAVIVAMSQGVRAMDDCQGAQGKVLECWKCCIPCL